MGAARHRDCPSPDQGLGGAIVRRVQPITRPVGHSEGRSNRPCLMAPMHRRGPDRHRIPRAPCFRREFRRQCRRDRAPDLLPGDPITTPQHRVNEPSLLLSSSEHPARHKRKIFSPVLAIQIVLITPRRPCRATGMSTRQRSPNASEPAATASRSARDFKRISFNHSASALPKSRTSRNKRALWRPLG